MIDIALLVTTLVSYGIPNILVQPMVCIAYEESRFQSAAINDHNRNGTKDYGLYQINSVWLDECNMTTTQLLEIDNNIQCAIIVYRKQGIKAWSTHKQCTTV